MRFHSILFLLFFTTQLTFSQLEFGLKVGLNFDAAGDIVVVADQLQKQGSLKGKTGYHLGVYAKVNILAFYLRPELQFTKVSSQFEDQSIETSRIELPVSFGINMLGPVSLFFGPTAFFNLSQASNELKLEEIQNKTSMGLHIGTRLKLGPIGVDLRYEKGLSAMESNLLSQAGVPVGGQINTQPNQFTVGVSFKLN
jgi:hypothetical protein